MGRRVDGLDVVSLTGNATGSSSMLLVGSSASGGRFRVTLVAVLPFFRLYSAGTFVESPLSPTGPLLVSRTGDAGFTESVRKESEWCG